MEHSLKTLIHMLGYRLNFAGKEVVVVNCSRKIVKKRTKVDIRFSADCVDNWELGGFD